MMHDRDELEAFKRLDLREYAAGQGYALDRKESWRGSAVMRNGAGWDCCGGNEEKLVLRRGQPQREVVTDGDIPF